MKLTSQKYHEVRCTGCNAHVPITVPCYIPDEQIDKYLELTGKNISNECTERSLAKRIRGTFIPYP